MQRSYRGTRYEYEPPFLDMVEGEVGGTYRGQTWKVRYPRHMPIESPPVALKYRGTAYVANANALADDIIEPFTRYPITRQQTNIQANIQCAVASQPQLAEWMDRHRSNLYSSVERRLQAAKQRGDRQLVGLLERELQDLAW